jgi:hypothetical protein
MKKTIKQMSEDFSRHHFEQTYPFILETVEWHLIGDKVLVGKNHIMEACNQSAQYLKGVRTHFKKFKTIKSNNCVVIDSLADYVDENDAVTTVASCDIYEFIGEQLAKITSYCIEISK